MPHKVEKVKGYWRVRSWVTGRLLPTKYRSKAKADERARESYNRSKRVRHTRKGRKGLTARKRTRRLKRGHY